MAANELAAILLPSLLAMIGGLVWQMYQVFELDHPFSPLSCLAFMFAAAVMGYAVGDFMREDFRGRHAFLIAAGTMPYVVLALLRKGLRRVLDRFGSA